MTEHDLKALMAYIREEEMCVQPESGQNYDCVNCDICYIAYEEKLRKELN